MFFFKKLHIRNTVYMYSSIYLSLYIYMYSECGLVLDHSMSPAPRELTSFSAVTEGLNTLQTSLPNNGWKDGLQNTAS